MRYNSAWMIVLCAQRVYVTSAFEALNSLVVFTAWHDAEASQLEFGKPGREIALLAPSRTVPGAFWH
jgi:hypothetical protein